MRRLVTVVDNYSELGALRLLPVGLFALLMAALAGGLLEMSAYWENLLGVWGLLTTLAAFFLVSLWYRNNYGTTLEAWPCSTREARRWAAAWTGAAALVAVNVVDFGTVAGFAGHLAGTAVLAWMLLYWRRSGRMWPQGYALMALLVVGASLHWASHPTIGQAYPAWALAVLGATMVVVGIVDHARLAKEAKPLEDDDG